MPIYYSVEEAINHPEVPKEWSDSIIVGLDNIGQFIIDLILQHVKKRRVCFLALDGYLGVDWERIMAKVGELRPGKGLEVEFINIHSYFKTASEIENLIAPYLECDPNFGYVFKGSLVGFFDAPKLEGLQQRLSVVKRKALGSPLGIICYGCGAALPALQRLYDYVFYFDLTREALFNRSERKPVFLLGSKQAVHQSLRHFYYLDSQVLDKQKKYVLKHTDFYVESNQTDEPKLMPKDSYEKILSTVVQSPFQLKPLYYSVAWGGNWLKKLKKLPESMVNSGQGFLVANENSIGIALGNILVEIPFQNLLWQEPMKLLGEDVFRKFKGSFPFAYWYDDGIDGGNMAIQVHPNDVYIREKFNEPMRQDESYYILHTGSGAKTYLGLKEDTDVARFYQLADKSEKEGISFDFDRYVNSIRTKPGDYFLIPAGTIHASGRNQMVLEIDWVVTAYSPGYTFHIYDYLRPDLDGTLRPIHLKHAFAVLRKERKTKWVLKNLKQKPRLIGQGDGWVEFLIGRRRDMYFEVHELYFEKRVSGETAGKFHLLTLVQGGSVLVQSQGNPNKPSKLDFPDTLIVPACVGKYDIVNLSTQPVKVVKTLVK